MESGTTKVFNVTVKEPAEKGGRVPLAWTSLGGEEENFDAIAGTLKDLRAELREHFQKDVMSFCIDFMYPKGQTLDSEGQTLDLSTSLLSFVLDSEMSGPHFVIRLRNVEPWPEKLPYVGKYLQAMRFSNSGCHYRPVSRYEAKRLVEDVLQKEKCLRHATSRFTQIFGNLISWKERWEMWWVTLQKGLRHTSFPVGDPRNISLLIPLLQHWSDLSRKAATTLISKEPLPMLLRTTPAGLCIFGDGFPENFNRGVQQSLCIDDLFPRRIDWSTFSNVLMTLDRDSLEKRGYSLLDAIQAAAKKEPAEFALLQPQEVFQMGQVQLCLSSCGVAEVQGAIKETSAQILADVLHYPLMMCTMRGFKEGIRNLPGLESEALLIVLTDVPNKERGTFFNEPHRMIVCYKEDKQVLIVNDLHDQITLGNGVSVTPSEHEQDTFKPQSLVPFTLTSFPGTFYFWIGSISIEIDEPDRICTVDVFTDSACQTKSELFQVIRMENVRGQPDSETARITPQRRFEDWMRRMPDDTPLKDMVCPGLSLPPVSPEKFPLDSMRSYLYKGIRALRIVLDGNSFAKTAAQVYSTLLDFLEQHPTETIFLVITDRDHSDIPFSIKDPSKFAKLKQETQESVWKSKLEIHRGQILQLSKSTLNWDAGLGWKMDSFGTSSGVGALSPDSLVEMMRCAKGDWKWRGTLFLDPNCHGAVPLLLCFNTYLSRGSTKCGCRVSGNPRISCKFRKNCKQGEVCDFCHLCRENPSQHARRKKKFEEIRNVFQTPSSRDGHDGQVLSSKALSRLATLRLHVLENGKQPKAALQKYEAALKEELLHKPPGGKDGRCASIVKECWRDRTAQPIDKLRNRTFAEKGLQKEEMLFLNTMFCLRLCSLAWKRLEEIQQNFRQRLRCLHSAAWILSKNPGDHFVISEFWAACAYCCSEAFATSRTEDVLRALRVFVPPVPGSESHQQLQSDEWNLNAYQYYVWTLAAKAAGDAGVPSLQEAYTMQANQNVLQHGLMGWQDHPELMGWQEDHGPIFQFYAQSLQPQFPGEQIFPL